MDKNFGNDAYIVKEKPFHGKIEDPERLPVMFVCVETRRKKNIGTLMRCAVAFGASNIIIVGSPKYSTHGSHEAKKFIRVQHFYYWKDCINFLRISNCLVYGLSSFQILPLTSDQNNDAQYSQPIDGFHFTMTNNAGFIIGETDGLTVEQRSLCDYLLHVRFPKQCLESYVQYDCKISISLHCYALQAGYNNVDRNGEKYLLTIDDTYSLDGKKASTEKMIINCHDLLCDGDESIPNLFDELIT